jgi:hypothetical protein
MITYLTYLTVCWCQLQKKIKENTSKIYFRKRKLVRLIFLDLIWIIREFSILRSDWCILRHWRFVRLVCVIDERISSRRCVAHESTQARETLILIMNCALLWRRWKLHFLCDSSTKIRFEKKWKSIILTKFDLEEFASFSYTSSRSRSILEHVHVLFYFSIYWQLLYMS